MYLVHQLLNLCRDTARTTLWSTLQEPSTRCLLPTLPMPPNHNCPAPGKFGSAKPLWKTATVNFLKVVRDVVPAFANVCLSFVAVWRQIVEGYRGALLAEMCVLLLVSLEQDVLPHIGHSLVPDDLIRDLGKMLQLASRLYELDLPIRFLKESRLAHQQGFSSLQQPVGADHTPLPTPPELRFDGTFDRQAKGAMHDHEPEHHEPERYRVAALCLPALLNRCAAVIKTYVADAALRGKMPLLRIRQEELTYASEAPRYPPALRNPLGRRSTGTVQRCRFASSARHLPRSPGPHPRVAPPLSP
ncbi:hypothetical protein JCM1840_000484 [Sporobolomyces johnsonii]